MSRHYSATDVVLFRGWKWKVVAVDFSKDPETLDLVALDPSTRPPEIKGLPVAAVTFVPQVLS